MGISNCHILAQIAGELQHLFMDGMQSKSNRGQEVSIIQTGAQTLKLYNWTSLRTKCTTKPSYFQRANSYLSLVTQQEWEETSTQVE